MFTIVVVIENVPVVVGKSLVCSDRNYWIAANEPSNFCQAQGWFSVIYKNVISALLCMPVTSLFFSMVSLIRVYKNRKEC